MTLTPTRQNTAASDGRQNFSLPLPKNYQTIYDIVEESGIGRHLTPSDIYAKARRRQAGIGFSTGLSRFERLRDLGLVAELHVPGADAATYGAGRSAPRALPLQQVRRDRGRGLCDSCADAQCARPGTRFRNSRRMRELRGPLGASVQQALNSNRVPIEGTQREVWPRRDAGNASDERRRMAHRVAAAPQRRRA